jgi:hypothetical protein
MATFIKDPDEYLDYQWDFSTQLTDDGDDTITGVPTITAPSGITLESQANSTTTVTAWLSGGTIGQRYSVECDMQTAGGRTYSRTIVILVKAL